jgi:hypothetical protein
MSQPLTQEQQQEVKQLAQAIAEAATEEFEQLTRTLVASGTSPFGQTEFTIRDILLRVGVKAYEQHLEQKKWSNCVSGGRPSAGLASCAAESAVVTSRPASR